MSDKLHVYEIAKDLGMDNKTLVALLRANGFANIRNHMSSLGAEHVDVLRRQLDRPRTPHVEERVHATVVLRRKADERQAAPKGSPVQPMGTAHQGDPVVVIPWDVVEIEDTKRARAGFDQYLIEFTGKDREVEKLLVRRDGVWASVRYVVQLNGRMRTSREMSKDEQRVAMAMVRAGERCLEAARKKGDVDKAERVEFVASSQPDGPTRITLYLTEPEGKRRKVGLVRVATERRAHQRRGHTRNVKTRDGEKPRWIKPVWVSGVRVVEEQRYTARRSKAERPNV